MTPAAIAALTLLWIAGTAAALALVFHREVAGAWREPVLTAPVLIVESDDWGYGPLEQADRLRELAAMLASHRDRAGNPAVMTLGVVLAGPDTERMVAETWQRYSRLTLVDPPLETVRSALVAGARDGVFSLHLHGMEHYWPSTLMAAARQAPAVRTWLASVNFPATEALPPELQSRWLDVPPSAIDGAAAEEAQMFAQACGSRPEVVVPPTFVWTAAVEQAWWRAGVRTIVTPGRRYTGRNALGKPANVDAMFHNGEMGTSGVTYLVRDVYFEPAAGHTAEQALDAFAAKSRLGRPTLLETHRANFLGYATASCSIAELDRLLQHALSAAPQLRFMSAAELANHYREGSELLERRLIPRIHCFLLRVAQVSRLRKLAWLSGAALPAALLWLATRSSRQAQST